MALPHDGASSVAPAASGETLAPAPDPVWTGRCPRLIVHRDKENVLPESLKAQLPLPLEAE